MQPTKQNKTKQLGCVVLLSVKHPPLRPPPPHRTDYIFSHFQETQEAQSCQSTSAKIQDWKQFKLQELKYRRFLKKILGDLTVLEVNYRRFPDFQIYFQTKLVHQNPFPQLFLPKKRLQWPATFPNQNIGGLGLKGPPIYGLQEVF